MNTNNQTLLEIKNIDFSYGKIEAICQLSLEIKKGESVVLLGANGCGKSTLIKILAGLIFPQRGDFFAFGKKIDEKLLSLDDFGIYFRSQIGIVFQNADVQLFNATVEEEISFAPLQMGEKKVIIKEKCQKIMEELGIIPLKERSPFALSGGEKRKVALASVLIMEPEILLLDEPTTGLDPKSEQVLIEVLLKHQASGKTTVISTHNLHFAPEIATRAVVFGENRSIIKDGPLKEILSDVTLLQGANLVHSHKHHHLLHSKDSSSMPITSLWHSHHHKHGDEK